MPSTMTCPPQQVWQLQRQRIWLRLRVKTESGEGTPEQTVVDGVIAELEHRLNSLVDPNYRELTEEEYSQAFLSNREYPIVFKAVRHYALSQGGADSIDLELFVAGWNPEVLVSTLLGNAAQLEIRPQRMGTEENLEIALVQENINELQAKLRQAEQDEERAKAQAKAQDHHPERTAQEPSQSIAADIKKLRKQLDQARADFTALYYDEPEITTEDIEQASSSLIVAPVYSVSVELTSDGSEKFTEMMRTLESTGRQLGAFVAVNGVTMTGEMVDVSVPSLEPSVATEESARRRIDLGIYVYDQTEADVLALRLNSKPWPALLELLEQRLIEHPDCPSDSQEHRELRGLGGKQCF